MRTKLSCTILGIILAIGFLSCAPVTDVHNHTFSTSWSMDKNYHWHEATCGHNELESDRATHIFGNWTVVKEATEETDGLRERLCVVCNYKETEEIANLSHIHTFDTTWTSDENYHWHAATCKHTTMENGKESHIYGDWVIITDATEETDGLKERFCTTCSYKETKVIASLSHVHTFETVWSSDENYHWHAATCKHTSEVNGKLEHNWNEGKVIIPPTETEEGFSTYTCMTCQKTKNVILKKLPHLHTFSSEWSKDETYHWRAATCAHTEETYGKAEHEWNNGEITKLPSATETGIKTFTCTICGKTKKENISKISVPVISVSLADVSDISVVSTTTETGILLTAKSGYDTYEWSSLGTILSKNSELNLLSSDYPLGTYVFDLLAKKKGEYYSASVIVIFSTEKN